MKAAELAESLDGRKEGNQWRCRCPVHDGKALMVKESDRPNPVIHCFAGCDFRDIVAHLKDRGLWEDDRKTDPLERRKRKRRRDIEQAKETIRRFEQMVDADCAFLDETDAFDREYLKYDRAVATLRRLNCNDEVLRDAA